MNKKSKIVLTTPHSAHITKFDKVLSRINSTRLLRGSIKDVHLTPLDQGDQYFVC